MEKFDKKSENRLTAFYIFLLVIGLLILLSGCKVREVIRYVEVPVIKKEYVEKIQHDSIHTTDSILIFERGDTVFLTRISIKYKDRLRIDTVSQTDSVTVIKTVEVDKYINELTRWQKWRLNAFTVLIILALLYLAFRLTLFFKK